MGGQGARLCRRARCKEASGHAFEGGRWIAPLVRAAATDEQPCAQDDARSAAERWDAQDDAHVGHVRRRHADGAEARGSGGRRRRASGR